MHLSLESKFWQIIKLKFFITLFLINSFLGLIVQNFVHGKRKFFKQSNKFVIPYDLTGWVAVITGGSSGIGLRSAKRLLEKNCHVVIATIPEPGKTMDDLLERLEQKELKNFNRDLWELQYMNLASFNSINKFVDDFKKSKRNIDILINNAAVFLVPFGITENGFERHIGVNYLGHCLLTLNLLSVLKPSKSTLNYRKQMNLSLKSKIVNISSYSHHWVYPDLQYLNRITEEKRDSYSMCLAYSFSKLLVIAFNFYLSGQILHKSDDSPHVISLHPGANATTMISESNIDQIFPAGAYKANPRRYLWGPEVGSNFVMAATFSKEFEEHKNAYLEFFDLAKPNKVCADTDFQKQVYQKTISLLGKHLKAEFPG